MKKYLLILLVICFFISTTECIQVLKLPVLIEHYKEHKKSNKQLNWLHFLYIHYVHEIQFDNDSNTDLKLPFKKNQLLQNNVDLNLYPLSILVTSVFIYIITLSRYSYYASNFISSSFILAVWQPPRHI